MKVVCLHRSQQAQLSRDPLHTPLTPLEAVSVVSRRISSLILYTLLDLLYTPLPLTEYLETDTPVTHGYTTTPPSQARTVWTGDTGTDLMIIRGSV